MPPDPSTPEAKLQHSLLLPSSHPSIAHFLFSSKHLLYHQDTLLPPTHFAYSLCVRLSHTYTPLATPSNPSSAALDMLFIPAAILHGVTVGYTVTKSTSGSEALLRGRFAADEKAMNCINVVHGLSKEASGIVTAHRASATVNVRRFFTIPNRVYSFERLPDTVLALLENVEYRVQQPLMLSSLPHSVPLPQLDDPLDFLFSDDVTDDAVLTTSIFDDSLPPSSAPTLPNTPSDKQSNPNIDQHSPSAPFTATAGSSGHPFEWFDTRHRNTHQTFRADEAGELDVYRDGRGNVLRDGAFDLSAIGDALKHVESTLSGDFYGPRVCTDILDELGVVLGSATGEMKARGCRTEGGSWERLREVAAFAYYASVVRPGDRVLAIGGSGAVGMSGDGVGMREGSVGDGCVSGDGMGGSEGVEDCVSGDGSAGSGGTACSFAHAESGETVISTEGDVGLMFETDVGDVIAMAEASGEHSEVFSVGMTTSRGAAVQKGLARIAPMPMLEPVPVTEARDCVVQDGKTALERKREAKKRYNRLSAARSNARKKERVERQQKELEELKKRVPGLRERVEELRRENEELKRRRGTG